MQCCNRENFGYSFTNKPHKLSPKHNSNSVMTMNSLSSYIGIIRHTQNSKMKSRKVLLTETIEQVNLFKYYAVRKRMTWSVVWKEYEWSKPEQRSLKWRVSCVSKGDLTVNFATIWWMALLTMEWNGSLDTNVYNDETKGVFYVYTFMRMVKYPEWKCDSHVQSE